MDIIDAETVDGERPKDVIDYIKDLKDVWPFSLLFPKEIPPDTIMIPEGEEQKDEVDLTKGKEKKIGENIDQGMDLGLGMLHFVLKYSVNDEVLKVIMFEAKRLVGKDPRGTSDPYAVISFDPRIRVTEYKTTVKMKTLNPIWNHVFVFQNITEDVLLKHKINITIFDWEKYGTHEALGEVNYELRKLCKKNLEDANSVKSDFNNGKNRIEQWLVDSEFAYNEDEAQSQSEEDPYEKKSDKLLMSRITEEDHLVVMKSVSMLSGSEGYSEEEEEEQEREEIELNVKSLDESQGDDDENKGATVNIIRRIEIRMNLKALENSRHSYGELNISLNYSIRTRRLLVVIIKARNMTDPSNRSLVPYCTLRHLLLGKDREVTKSTHTTSYRFYTANPVWNEEFQLKAAPDKLRVTAVEIQVFNSTKAVKPKDELLGVIRLGLQAYPLQKEHWVKFLSNIGKPIEEWHIIRQ